MALRRTRYGLLVLLALFFLVTPRAIYSCGPFLETAVFAFRDQPDGPAENFAAGALGIVRPSFRISYLVIAYRYLIGLQLTPAQQKAAIEVWNRDAVPDHPPEEESAARWDKARSQVPDLPPAPNISPLAPVSHEQPYFQYVSCPGEAFQTAAKTLDDRAAKFGFESAAIHEWVSAQDQVFANCGGNAHIIPAELSSTDSLQRADRAYQIASANFYARSFDKAVQEFDAIAKDPSSPWAPISPYLAARALIRKATLNVKPDAPFDPAPMAEAQHRLEQIVSDPKASAIHASALKLLNYVRFRTEPANRVAELEQVMLRPDPGPAFKQDLWDYVLLLSRGEQAGDLSEWVKSYSALAENVSNRDNEALAKHSLAEWHGAKALPWLIATLRATNPAGPELASLLPDARSVSSVSPGYLTVQYYALERMAASGQKDSARSELDHLLSKIDAETPAGAATPLGSYNLLNDLRLTLTTSLDDFLAHAGERAVGADEGPGTDEQIDHPGGINKNDKFLTPYAAKVFQQRLPLALLTEAAQSTVLTKPLRRDIARSTWVRAILLNDIRTATQLQATLQATDPPLWKSMEAFRAAPDDAAKHFTGIFLILQNPGLMPSARKGYPRRETLGEIDAYRDNWWCASMNEDAYPGDAGGASPAAKSQNEASDAKFPFSDWVSAPQRSAALKEWEGLSALGTAPNYLARQILARAKQDQKTSLVPQALYLTVRATRFGCSDAGTSALSKEAFEFLHQHYPESEWTAKTKYYY